jgi:hypothetical protein
MMKIFGIAYSLFTAAWMAIVVAGTAWPMGAADWAAWMGAIFTGLAFAGTIWIATGETRRSKQAALLNAQLVASSMVLRIVYAAGRVQRVLDEMVLSGTTDRGYPPFAVCAEYLTQIDLWSVDELLPLTATPKIAVQLAEARDQILATIKILVAAPDNRKNADGPGRMAFCEMFHKHVLVTHKKLTDSVEMCKAAASALQVSAFR